jgi:5-methylcytosine-specific restriction endonuclease McrA
VFADVVGGLASRLWLAGLLALIILTRIVRLVRAVVHGRHRQDPQRRFSGQQRAEIIARAGHRCEQYSWLSGRCGATENLQADHVHPHRRGGATAVGNGQALCRRHNKDKSARVPWNWQLDRLARRRTAYFPPGTSTDVVRHRSTADLVVTG